MQTWNIDVKTNMKIMMKMMESKTEITVSLK